jgi:hypothetical protein
MNKNKVNLSSTNNTKQPPKQKTKNLLRRQSGPTRDTDGKFATKGSGGLSSLSNLNWKRMLPVILIIAITGGFFVYRSLAATGLLATPGTGSGTSDCTAATGTVTRETSGNKRNASVCELTQGKTLRPVVFNAGGGVMTSTQAGYLTESGKVTTTGYVRACYNFKKVGTANPSVTVGGYAPGSSPSGGTTLSITNTDYNTREAWCDPVAQRAGSSRPFFTVNSGTVRVASIGVVATSAPVVPPVTTIDPFGVTKLYPTISGGKVWNSKWNNGTSRSFGSVTADPQDNWFTGRGNGNYSTSGNGILNISGANPRMYVQDPSSTPSQWRNVEITMYFNRVSDNSTAYAGMVSIARSNHKRYDVDPCDSRGIGARFRNDGRIDFEKETSHPASSPTNNKAVAGWNNNTYNRWIGYKYVVYDLPNGQVKLENYIDTTDGANGGTWTKVNELIDTGSNFGVGGTPCRSGIDPAMPLTAATNRTGSESGQPNLVVYFRSDGVNTNGLQYKKGSVREIQAPIN